MTCRASSSFSEWNGRSRYTKGRERKAKHIGLQSYFVVVVVSVLETGLASRFERNEHGEYAAEEKESSRNPDWNRCLESEVSEPYGPTELITMVSAP